MFDDPTMEIQELTAVIKQDITALNSAVVDLQLHCNSQNETTNISTDTTSHSTTVVDNLKNRLMSTTKEFKDVLTMRTEVYLIVYVQLCSFGRSHELLLSGAFMHFSGPSGSFYYIIYSFHTSLLIALLIKAMGLGLFKCTEALCCILAKYYLEDQYFVRSKNAPKSILVLTVLCICRT